jgi:hypothetical protein
MLPDTWTGTDDFEHREKRVANAIKIKRGTSDQTGSDADRRVPTVLMVEILVAGFPKFA